MEFRVSGLGYGVKSSRFRVQCLKYGVFGPRLRVLGLGCSVLLLQHRRLIEQCGIRVKGVGFSVWL
jgi:hypothetical protein